MSFQEEKRSLIKRYMLDKIDSDDPRFVQKTAQNFEISETTVKRYLNDGIREGQVQESEETSCHYVLAATEERFLYDVLPGMLEDPIYFHDILPALRQPGEPARRIWGYCFMEMMNNALDHAKAEHIECRLRQNALYTEIAIADDGIGLFQNIRSYLSEKLSREITAQDIVTELYKGKLTTNPKEHSGEGIFFTSKMMSRFILLSGPALFRTGFGAEEKLTASHLIAYYTKLSKIGTLVILRLGNNCTRTPKEVFDMFAPIDDGFVKTVLPIRDICPYGEPIARSQARRILYRLETFQEIQFDFSEVDFMGQGFADEIFRVFHNKYPNILLVPLYANDSVLGMIQHVQSRQAELAE